MPETVLYLDTTTDILMLGISMKGAMVRRHVHQSSSRRYHSAVLIPAIQALLSEAGLSPSDLTAMAVNQGPGSFTGVRTGISTARTMSQFLDIPVHVINRFEILARDICRDESPAPVTVVLDALRGRLYAATLHFTDNGPAYDQAPAMRMAGEWEPPAGSLLVEASLLDVFADRQPEVVRSDLFSPEVMLRLTLQYGGLFRKDWREIKPLYLQEPNITMRKAQSGRY